MGWYFLPDLASLSAGERFLVDGEEARHMVRAARVRPGEKVVFFDGGGLVLEAAVVDTLSGKVLAEPAGMPFRHLSPVPSLHLAVGMVPLDRMKSALYSAVAAGIASFTPLVCERTQAGRRRASKGKELVEVLRRTAVSACKQAENPFLPDIRMPETPGEFARGCDEGEVAVLFATSLHDAAALADILREPDVSGCGTIRLMVGPEGGFSEAEYEEAVSLGGRPVRMGPYIFRTENAAGGLAAAVRMFLSR